MHIEIREAALRQLDSSLSREACFLQIVYDTEGCGCAVNGVPSIWAVSHTSPSRARLSRAESATYEVRFDPNHEIFFDEQMVIDYSQVKRCFSLKSDSQTFHPCLLLKDYTQTGRNPNDSLE